MRQRRVTSTIIIEIRKEIKVDYVVDVEDGEDATDKLNEQVNSYRRMLGDKNCFGAGTVTETIPLSLIEGATARVWTGGYGVEHVKENGRG